jgi:tRNA(Ile)-lysidine synthase
MLTLDTTHLRDKKNLLAFSAGIDSSALFFLLIENNIKFDIAIVDYGIREESKKEVAHAHTLAKKYSLTCHSIKAPEFTNNFEKHARDFRYDFFSSLVEDKLYENILTAHQLNDCLEWLLMRLSKGAGLCELVGLAPESKLSNYMLLRPLLSFSKEELLAYLKTHKHPYFVDKSNTDVKYERNKFRTQFSDGLMSQYAQGIKKSFEYLQKDKERLENTFETLKNEKSLYVIKLHALHAKVKATDLTLKKLGYLLSAAQRNQIENEKSLVIGAQWAVEFQDELLYICPYMTDTMTKEFKEKCRVLKVPRKIRAYCFCENIDISNLLSC